MKKLRVWTGAALLTAALGLVSAGILGTQAGAGRAVAANDRHVYCVMFGAGKTADEVTKIAALIKKGDMEKAKAMAAEIAKKYDTVEDAMDLFKIKKKDGIGFGPKETDGIESKIRETARDGPKNIKADASLYEEAGYITIAIGLIAEAKTPAKDLGKKTVKGWKTANNDMIEAAQSWVKAAQAKGATDLKNAATKLNNACNACHSEHRN